MGSQIVIPDDRIARRILAIRGHQVLLDADLAEIYGVTTKRLNEQVKRNHNRFPLDFMFRLTRAETQAWNRSRFATGSQKQKHRDPRFPPYAFTEHGALMLANILKSRIAVQASIHVVRAFVRIRRFAASNAYLARRLAALERKVGVHDSRMKQVFALLRELLEESAESSEREKEPRIGFGSRS